MRTFRDRVAVVTGAASGIGLALARRFAAEGMRVVLADVEEAALEAARHDLDASGARVVAVRTDVADPDSVEALAARAQEAFGSVHVLCNNAGIVAPGRSRPVWEHPLEDWRWTLEVNLMGVVHGIRSFVPAMLAGGEDGHIINTASLAGFVGGGSHVVYSTSKFGVVRVSEALHANLAERGAPIGVTVLCPGVVMTNIRSAERNRPDALRPATEASETGSAYSAAIAEVGAVAMPPDAVATVAFEAIRANRFYAFTTGAWDGAIRERAEAVLARDAPPAPDLATLIRGEADERSGA